MDPVYTKLIDDSFREAVSKVIVENDADVILYSGPIYPHCDCVLESQIARSVKKVTRRRPNVLLMINTTGGVPDVAYRIARAIQRRAGDGGKFTIAVPSMCKSSGTLIAAGADEIAMSDRGELGPLDIQIRKKDELDEYTSGLNPLHALATLRAETFKAFQTYFLEIRKRSWQQISTASASQIAGKLAADCFAPIYQQIDPLVLGETQRAMEITHSYAARLDRGNLKADALPILVGSYPSHSYVIDREEAEDLFNQVRNITEAEARLYRRLAKLHAQVHEECPILIECFSDPATPPANAKKKGVSDAETKGKKSTRVPKSTADQRGQDRKDADRSTRQPVANKADEVSSDPPDLRRNGRMPSTNGTH